MRVARLGKVFCLSNWIHVIHLVILRLMSVEKLLAQGVHKMSLLNVDAALQVLLEQAQSALPLETEEIDLDKAENRVLAEPLMAQFAMPPWPNSSMDGYAVRSSEIEAGQALPVSQKVFAGQQPKPLQIGSCARIF